MQFDDMLRRYFGTDDFASVSAEARDAGTERMRVDLGLERDRARRFALWMLLYQLDAAPDLDVAFRSEEERDAARNMMDLLAAGAEQQ